jgi:hypothetical protein
MGQRCVKNCSKPKWAAAQEIGIHRILNYICEFTNSRKGNPAGLCSPECGSVLLNSFHLSILYPQFGNTKVGILLLGL